MSDQTETQANAELDAFTLDVARAVGVSHQADGLDRQVVLDAVLTQRREQVRPAADFELITAVLEQDYTAAPDTTRTLGNVDADRAAALANAAEMHHRLRAATVQVAELRASAADADRATKYYGAQSKRRKAQREEIRVQLDNLRAEKRTEAQRLWEAERTVTARDVSIREQAAAIETLTVVTTSLQEQLQRAQAQGFSIDPGNDGGSPSLADAAGPAAPPAAELLATKDAEIERLTATKASLQDQLQRAHDQLTHDDPDARERIRGLLAEHYEGGDTETHDVATDAICAATFPMLKAFAQMVELRDRVLADLRAAVSALTTEDDFSTRLHEDVKAWFHKLSTEAASDPANISGEAQDLLERVLLDGPQQRVDRAAKRAEYNEATRDSTTGAPILDAAILCDGEEFAALPDCGACGGCGKDTTGTAFAEDGEGEADRDAVGQLVSEFGCTPSGWATEQAVEKLFEFYRVYDRPPAALVAAPPSTAVPAAPPSEDRVFRYAGGGGPVYTLHANGTMTRKVVGEQAEPYDLTLAQLKHFVAEGTLVEDPDGCGAVSDDWGGLVCEKPNEHTGCCVAWYSAESKPKFWYRTAELDRMYPESARVSSAVVDTSEVQS